MDNLRMCTARAFVKRPACVWHVSFSTEGCVSRSSRVACGPGRGRGYPSSRCRRGNWRRFRRFVSVAGLSPMQYADQNRRRLLMQAAGLTAAVLTAARMHPLVAAPGAVTPSATRLARPRRIIIDTDPGVDDALAIFLALKSP